MRYFRLLDDVHVPKRWHLGEVTVADGTPQEYDNIRADGTLSVEITDAGRALDFCLTSFAIPVATNAVGERIAAVAGDDLQRFAVNVRGPWSNLDKAHFEVLSASRAITCLDERRSEFMKWTESDHRPDLAGAYQMVTELYVDAACIPSSAHLFRIKGWEIALIVSESVKAAIEEGPSEGAVFIKVT